MITLSFRKAELWDLPKMETIASQFYASSEHLETFEISKFCELWSGLISAETGVIFAIFADDEVVGALGGFRYRDPYCSAMIAAEMFWFVSETYRGSGLSLYKMFEKWARDTGCSSIKMGFLVDSMPDKMQILYKRMGFKVAEHLYIKSL